MKIASINPKALYRKAEKNVYKLALLGLANLLLLVICVGHVPEWVLILWSIPTGCACGISSGILMFPPKRSLDDYFDLKH